MWSSDQIIWYVNSWLVDQIIWYVNIWSEYLIIWYVINARSDMWILIFSYKLLSRFDQIIWYANQQIIWYVVIGSDFVWTSIWSVYLFLISDITHDEAIRDWYVMLASSYDIIKPDTRRYPLYLFWQSVKIIWLRYSVATKRHQSHSTNIQ